MTTVGVLALQGDFAEHAASLAEAWGGAARSSPSPAAPGTRRLIIPGGESTTIARLLDAYGLLQPLQELGREGLPIWGTCAGAIILARRAPGLDRPNSRLWTSASSAMPLAARSTALRRISPSRQSAIPRFTPSSFGRRSSPTPDPGRGPGDASRRPHRRRPQRSLLATAFHPELAHDGRFHKLFVEIAKSAEHDDWPERLNCSMYLLRSTPQKYNAG